MNTDKGGPKTEVAGGSRASARRRKRRRASRCGPLDVVLECNQALKDVEALLSCTIETIATYREHGGSMTAAEKRAFVAQTTFMAVNVHMFAAALDLVEKALDEALLQASPEGEVAAAREQTSQTQGGRRGAPEWNRSSDAGQEAGGRRRGRSAREHLAGEA